MADTATPRSPSMQPYAATPRLHDLAVRYLHEKRKFLSSGMFLLIEAFWFKDIGLHAILQRVCYIDSLVQTATHQAM